MNNVIKNTSTAHFNPSSCGNLNIVITITTILIIVAILAWIKYNYSSVIVLLSHFVDTMSVQILCEHLY